MEILNGDRLAELALQARIWWCVAAVSMAIFVLMLLRLGRALAVSAPPKNNASGLRQFIKDMHQSRSATASMEFLMVLLPFLIIVMTIWQLAFMFNAQMHVGYAAYAAARSASVIIPAEMNNEAPGELKKSNLALSTKWGRIHAAAIPGTLAISPGEFVTGGKVALQSTLRRGGLGDLGSLPPLGGVLPRLTLMTAHYGRTDILGGTRTERALAKNVYAEKMTTVLVNNEGHKKDQLGLEDAERVDVTVHYVFWLHVPYVGPMLEAAFADRYKNPLTGEYIFLLPHPSILLTETITMTSWPLKRAIEPCN